MNGGSCLPPARRHGRCRSRPGPVSVAVPALVSVPHLGGSALVGVAALAARSAVEPSGVSVDPPQGDVGLQLTPYGSVFEDAGVDVDIVFIRILPDVLGQSAVDGRTCLA
jgi:hypothetical protein